MHVKNQTLVSEIVLLGFQNLHNFKIPLFSLFLLIYIVTVWENVLIIVLVSISRNLQSPMFFFLQQLSLSDLLQTATVVPNMIRTVIKGEATIALSTCIIQFYFFGGSESFECLLLAVMSYDRYVAICIPLRLLGFGIVLITANIIINLPFCELNLINHFFCDLSPLLELSCSDTFLVRIQVTLLSIPVIICPFILIIVSYMCIAHAILKIVSNTGRQKAFSTCSSHLAVVSLFYGTLIAIYVVPPTEQSQTMSKVLSLLYTVGIPLINPVIYSLRSQDMKDALKKSLLNGACCTLTQ
ncbi:hypothetical protein XELAEV_18019636mg [Xenopus laevis]|uniref:Olfactory receptor n=1 Tax=Xenopus laevis TaxID=8355 RepID=A0A974DHD7_XENLA|nr:hypothetical protein XELAEV_18019636mg [Xenopus laevis]